MAPTKPPPPKGRVAAEQDRKRVLRWREAILDSARRHGMPPDVLCAIISRETRGFDRWSQPPPIGQMGDGGHGHGPMQIDDRSFPDWCRRWRDSELGIDDAIEQGATVLADKYAECSRLFGVLDPPTVLRYAIAAYNCGAGGVKAALRKGADVDAHTTGKDYSADVLERAEVFRVALAAEAP